MTVKTRAELQADIDTYIAPNGQQAITAVHVNDRFSDIADSALFPEDQSTSSEDTEAMVQSLSNMEGSLAALEGALAQIDVLDVTWTVDTAALAAGEVMNTTPQEVVGFFLGPESVTHLLGLYIHDGNAQGGAFDLYIQTAQQSLGTQNAAPTLTAAQAEGTVAVIPVDSSNFTSLVASKKGFVPIEQIPVREIMGAGVTTSVWITGVARSSATYANGTLKLKFCVEKYQ